MSQINKNTSKYNKTNNQIVEIIEVCDSPLLIEDIEPSFNIKNEIAAIRQTQEQIGMQNSTLRACQIDKNFNMSYQRKEQDGQRSKLKLELNKEVISLTDVMENNTKEIKVKNLNPQGNKQECWRQQNSQTNYQQLSINQNVKPNLIKVINELLEQLNLKTSKKAVGFSREREIGRQLHQKYASLSLDEVIEVAEQIFISFNPENQGSINRTTMFFMMC